MSGSCLESIFRHDPITAVIVRYFGPEEICRLTATCRYFRFVWLKKHEQILFLFTRGNNSGMRTMEDWQANIERAFKTKNGGYYCVKCLSDDKRNIVCSVIYHGITICIICFCERMRTTSISKALRKMGYMYFSDIDLHLKPYLTEDAFLRAREQTFFYLYIDVYRRFNPKITRAIEIKNNFV